MYKVLILTLLVFSSGPSLARGLGKEVSAKDYLDMCKQPIEIQSQCINYTRGVSDGLITGSIAGGLSVFKLSKQSPDKLMVYIRKNSAFLLGYCHKAGDDLVVVSDLLARYIKGNEKYQKAPFPSIYKQFMREKYPLNTCMND